MTIVIPSILAAELLASFRTKERTSELEQEKQERVELKLYWGMGVLEASAWLKHSAKNGLKVLAMSVGELAQTP